MLKEYRVRNNYIIDEMDLDAHDFKVRDVNVTQRDGEILVYNTCTKRVQSVKIPSKYHWNGSTVEIDFNLNEEQKRIEAEKRMKTDIAKASIAYIAHQNGWIENYDEEGINNWFSFLKKVANGEKTSLIIPSRPAFLKDF
ncbi:MAG: hypothetical protein ACRDD8_05440 [Bacteroidales bacterium]